MPTNKELTEQNKELRAKISVLEKREDICKNDVDLLDEITQLQKNYDQVCGQLEKAKSNIAMQEKQMHEMVIKSKKYDQLLSAIGGRNLDIAFKKAAIFDLTTTRETLESSLEKNQEEIELKRLLLKLNL